MKLLPAARAWARASGPGSAAGIVELQLRPVRGRQLIIGAQKAVTHGRGLGRRRPAQRQQQRDARARARRGRQRLGNACDSTSCAG